jgi:site-specific DNA-methyltransferase (adenine-specific)
VPTPVRLFNGDCLDVLPKLAGVDAVVTDPPYGIAYRRGSSSRTGVCTTWKPKSRPIAGDGVPFDPSPWLAFPAIAFTGAQYFYDRLPPGGVIHCWDKRGNYKPLDQADADMVWCSTPNKSRVFHLAWRGLCRHAENRTRFVHPTQKPVALMAWIIGLLKLPPGATILDPYAGSGTTGVAAVQMGFKFIGCEIDPGYFQTMRSRIAEARATARRELTRAA